MWILGIELRSSCLGGKHSIIGAITYPGLVPLHLCSVKRVREGEDEDEDHDITGRKVIVDKGAFWVRQLYKWQGKRRECAFPIYSLYLYVFRSLLLFHIY